ncbi:MAG: alpha-glucosidase [Clostridia bacterium]|nr:alpha-glucosidase [Clostridia bacterium]
MRHTHWYRDSVIYQIYPRSFCDSNGDGIGDIQGIISKIDYLKDLGVNCVWLSPVYDSPQKDNGYDVSDYYNIYPPFGTMEDFKEMLDKMHAAGIRVIMDLVVNHTSSEHPWFKDAISNPDSPYRDFYIIRHGRREGLLPPTNWTGFFGGSTWERIHGTNDYYLHLFSKDQPDLNWDSKPMRTQIVKMIKFWLDMGVDGFRCDVINVISKNQKFRNGAPALFLRGRKNFINGPRIHEYMRRLYKYAFRNYDCTIIGETALSNVSDARLFTTTRRKELNMIFNFEHTDTDNYFGVKYLYRKFKLKRFKERIAKYQYGLADVGWNSLFIENHDQRRSVGRFGTTDSPEYKNYSSKMLALCYFMLRGTPFIYQGQELGMTNIGSKDLNDYQDVELMRMHKMAKKHPFIKMLIGKHMYDVSRDNARTPMQWDSSEYAGFSTAEPWLKVNPDKDKVNAKAEMRDHDSL